MEHSNKPSRQHRNDEEVKALLKEFEESKKTVKEFCEIYSIHETTFYQWRNKHSPKKEMQGEFIQIVNDLTAIDTSSVYAELELPSKVIVRFFEKPDVDLIKALM
jgi:transposase-like protein